VSSTGVCSAVLRSESVFRRHLVIQHGLQLHTYAKGVFASLLDGADTAGRTSSTSATAVEPPRRFRAAVRRDIHRQTSVTSRPPGVFSARGEVVLPPPPRCMSSPSMPAQQPLPVPPSILLFRYMPPPLPETPQLPASLSSQAGRSSPASPAMSVDSEDSLEIGAWGDTTLPDLSDFRLPMPTPPTTADASIQAGSFVVDAATDARPLAAPYLLPPDIACRDLASLVSFQLATQPDAAVDRIATTVCDQMMPSLPQRRVIELAIEFGTELMRAQAMVALHRVSAVSSTLPYFDDAAALRCIRDELNMWIRRPSLQCATSAFNVGPSSPHF